SSLATFSGGRAIFLEEAFETLDGVFSVVTGRTDTEKEAIQIIFNPDIISYVELVDIYWQQIDPTDDRGSFSNRGEQYAPAIFYHSGKQKAAAETSRQQLRSEEHTSELQSRENLVCRLLLEKKKTQQQ